ncbi:TlpA family protein disulfide reductase [Gemmata sp.]|uniref:TlpA family protein disulfide reductase n=1 Tax=Gemmata sp. TaxID=1914242 RepID=UPI003F70E0E5
MRLLLTLALTLGLCGLAGALDDKKPEDKKPEEKKDEPKTPAEKFAALRKEFETLEKDFRAAKTNDERADLRAKFVALRPKLLDAAVALATDDAKNPALPDAAEMAFGFGLSGAGADKVAAALAEHHGDSPKLKALLPSLGGSEAGRNLLKVLPEKSKNKDVQGAALYYLGAGILEEGDSAKPGDKQVAAFKEAEGLLRRAAKEFGDVEIGGRRGDREPLAKAVEAQLFFLNNLTVGKVLPDSACEDLDGKKVKISDYRGKVVVLDIWATWCGPCRAMIPHERELVKNLKDKPFAFISLSADDEKDTLVKFIEKEPMPWVHWWNGGAKGGPVADYKVQFFPTVYVLDEKGVIRFKHVREKAMDEAIDVLLKEIKPKG